MNRLVVALAALAFAASASAQEARPVVGFGVAITPLQAVPGVTAPTVELYLPIRIAPLLRIEPSLGIRTVDRPSSSNLPDERDVTLGVGVFAMKRVTAPLDIYFGGRLKLNFARFETQTGFSNSGTDVIIAAALGGEYFPISRFSLGLEGQLGYYSNSSAAVDADSSGVFTTGIAVLRLYFL